MDCNYLWKVTTVPSISLKTTSLSGVTFSTKTVSVTSEQESKQNLSFPDENEKENEDARKATKRSKIKSSSLDHPDFNINFNNSRRSDHSKKTSISEISKTGKKLNDPMDEMEKLTTENILSEMCQHTDNSVDAPFIELGAVYKVLDFITDSDPNVLSLTNNCCNEISKILRYLLTQRHDKTLEDLLSNDSSLRKCDRCGVISYMMQSHSIAKEITESNMKIRDDTKIVTAEHECVKDNQSNKKSKLSSGYKISPSISALDIKTNAQSKLFLGDCTIDRVKCKHELNRRESLPIKKCAFAMKNYIENLNRTNEVSDAEADVSTLAKMKTKLHLNNSAVTKDWLSDKPLKSEMRHQCNDATQIDHDRNDNESLSSAKTYTDVDKEEIVRKLSYEPKSQIDDLLAEMWDSKSAQKIQHSQQSLTKQDDIYTITDTVKYLARGPFAISDREENELFSKLQNGRCVRLTSATKGQSSVLYGSRNDYPQRSSGFWLFDESGHLPEVLDEHCYLPISRLDDQESVRFTANILRRSNFSAEKLRKNDSWSDCLGKDSLEECARLQFRGESDTVTFSSSSAENLIHEWMGSVDTRNEINYRNVPRGRRLVSSKPSLDISRRVKAEIARDTCFDNAEKSQSPDSSIVAQLSPEIRRKICRLIQKILLLDSINDSFYREKCFTTKALNGENLLHSKSVNARFIHSNNQITNTCTNDNIPQVFDLSENENYLLNRSVNSVDTYSQDLNKSKNSIQISEGNTITLVSPDKSIRQVKRTDNCMKQIRRQIIYKDTSSRNMINKHDEHSMTEILSIYREILENSGNMEWNSFQELVEDLHPDQKEIWRAICGTISEEARRERADDANDSIEVCIEISLMNPEGTVQMNAITACTGEIVFEVDMTLKDIENFLDKKLRSTDQS